LSGITSSLGRDSRQITARATAARRGEEEVWRSVPRGSALNDAIAERNQLQSEMAAETKAKEEASKNPQPIQTEGAAGPLQSAGPEMGRREFIKGATAVAGGFMLHGKLYAKPAGLIAELAPSLNGAVPLPRPLSWIAQNSENAEYRRLAQKIMPLVQGVSLRSVEWKSPYGANSEYGTWVYSGADRRPGQDFVPDDIGYAAHGVTLTGPTGEDQVWLAKAAESQGVDGWNESTVLHEALHAAVIRYYGLLSVRLPNPRADLQSEGYDREAFPRSDKADAAMEDIRAVWKAASAAWKEQGGGLTVEDNGEKTMSPRAARITNGLQSADELISYAFTDTNMQAYLRTLPSQKADGRSLWQRLVDAIRSLFSAQTVSRSALNDVMDAANQLLTEVQGQRPVPPGKGNLQDMGASLKSIATGPLTPASPDFGGETERRWQDAKKGIGDGPSTLEKAKAWWEDLTGGFTRHWRALPNTPQFADVSQQLRKLEAAPHAAMTHSVEYLRSLVSKMDAKEYDVFARKVVLDDLAWDAGEGRELPFGFTPSTLTAARANVDALINANPKLVKAVRERKAHNAQITDAMVESGVLTKDQVKNPAYFRHMVLDYARHEAALARSPTSVKSPYWARRMGSTLDINANLLEAELDWLQKAQIDTATADTIEWLKNSKHNSRKALQDRARADNKAKLDAELVNNPSARKEDAWFRSNLARGFQIVKDELEAGNITGIPPHLRGAADAILSGSRDGESPLPLMAWILDGDRPGGMGAGMVLKYTGLRKQWQRNLLGDAWRDTSDLKGLVRHYKPEGQVAWQPKEGRHLFTAKTISESALDMFAGKLADTATPGVDREELARALGTVRQQLVVGQDRYTMVLPEEIAATLDEFGDRRGEGMVARVASGIQSAWKRWQLINPRRYLKYNLNNTTGDLDAVIAGNPGTLRRVGEAWRMLREAGKGSPSARYTEALERGVFTSALSAQEIPDINRLSAFRHLTEDHGLRPDKLAIAGVGKLWRALQDSTNFRESLFRLAAYLDYVDKIEGGMPQLKVGYGASVPQIVDAVTDPKDKAALLARDLLGDYGSISVAGTWLRRYLIPFWSWMEINTRRYWRLTANAYTTSKGRGIATGGLLGASVAARTGIALYIRMALVYALLNLWNDLWHHDEEKELGEVQRAQLHLILGRDADGNVITLRTQGALSDVLSELGFTDAMHAFNQWRDGQGSLGSVATSMAAAPVNRVATSVRPEITEAVELMIGQKLWPDIFHPRVIHDKWRELFQTVSLENEYDALAGKPSRGYPQSWVASLVYKRNPDEMAYDESRTIAYEWLQREKGERGGSSTSDRGEALRDYRLALRYGDQKAAQAALARYESLGGTKGSLSTSIKRAHPLGPIAKKDRAAFLASLTDDQLDTFQRAERYWQDTFEGQ
jgi:hypothetical protein